jgi:hypothetical protein
VQLTIDGQGNTRRPKGPEMHLPFRIMVKAQCPQLLILPRRLVATDVFCNMLITPGLVQFVDEGPQHPAISATFYGGSLVAHGAIRTGEPTKYDLAGNLANVELSAFARDWTNSQEKLSHLNGRAYATLQLSTASPHGGKNPTDLLHGDGTFEVLDGEFYQLPIVSEIAAAITLNKDAGTVGQAAARFHFANRQIQFDHIAVAAPVLGVQGDGNANFDGQLDLRVVVAPLADWKKQLQKTNVPLLDSVGAELLGGIQTILDKTTGKLLYQFRVTGTPSKPDLTPQPVPILTEDAAKLLVNMLKGTGRLLDEI